MLEPLPEPLALLRRHVRPALAPHARSPVTVPATPPAQPPEQDTRQQQQPHRLPALQRRSPKQARDEQAPQAHHHQAQVREGRDRQRHPRSPRPDPTGPTYHTALPLSATNPPRPP